MTATAVLLLFALAAAPGEGPRKLDFAGVLERARTQPSVEVARASAEAAHAKAREVSRMWLPTLEMTLTGGPSQGLSCVPSAENCISTNTDQIALGFDGIFGRLDGNLRMPLFTFGKLSAGSRAAEAGAKAGDALALGAERDAAMDAARAYFAVKLGRDLLAMLDEGMEYVDEELAREEKLLAEGSGEITETDHRRVLTLRAEIQARISEARRVEELGLAGVRYATGDFAADVDDKPLAPAIFELPNLADARLAAERRPERAAAQAGAEAADGLADLERARWWPDFVLVGSGTLAGSSSVEHPKNAFLNDPYNATGGALGLVLRWAPEPGVRGAKIDQADAERARAEATLRMARQGLPAEAEKAWAEARDARDRMKASEEGEGHAKAWLASVLQSEAAGLAEPRDVADALLQYFLMRARLIQATFDWNVGVVALQRALGEPPGGLRFVEEE